MAKVNRKHIQEAYIEGIRTALLVDDRFPTFQTSLNGKHVEEVEKERALKLWKICRDRKWLCDVESDIDKARGHHLHQSDLLVLDYHLDTTREEDPSKALGVIQELSCTPFFNLVVVYTAEPELDGVARDIAFCLGAGGEPCSDEERASLDELISEKEDLGEEIPKPSKRVLNAFMKGRRDNGFLQEVIDLFGHGPQVPKLVQRIIEHYFEKKISGIGSNVDRRRGRSVEFKAAEDPAKLKWIQSGNVFVVVVSKTTSPFRLISKLEKALLEWSPSPVHLMLAHAKNEIEKGGVEQSAAILNDRTKEAAWMFHASSNDGPADHEEKVGQLYSGLFEALGNNVTPKVAEFGARFLEPKAPKVALATAKKMAKLSDDVTKEDIVFKLNEFLATTKFTGRQITTGVVFREKTAANNSDSYWLCVSPACGLVPGQQDEWERGLEPSLPISVMRLSLTKASDAINKDLKTATRCRRIFLEADGKRLSLVMMSEESRTPNLEKVFVDGGGKVSAGDTFTGHIVGRNGHRKIELMSKTFEVIAILRPEYANRALAQAGNHASRIGVDYVNLP